MKDKSNRKFKDSGIEWIGKIPKEWEVARIGSVYKLRNEKVSDYDYMPLSVTMNGVVPQLDTAAKTNAHEDRKLVLKGDFAINSRSDRRGSCGISDYNGSVSLINTVITPIENMSSRYYNWIFHTEQFADEFYKCGHGIVDDLWTTSWQEMKNISITIPSIEEQIRIAKFLDNKCSKIDKIINDINKQIETLVNYKKSLINDLVTGKKVLVGANSPVDYLKLCEPEKTKDSGIEWIEKVPSDWKLSKVKYEYEFSTGFTPDTTNPLFYDNENGYNWVTISDMYNNNKILKDTKTKVSCYYVDMYKPKIVLKDSLLYSFKLSVGSVAFTTFDVFTNEAIASFYNKDLNKLKFLYYASKLIEYNSNHNIYNAKILNEKLIKNARITCPPVTEQKNITRFLDNKCSKIDKIISDKKQQIELLEKYKKSLIFEYVTGKKQV